MIYNIVLKTHQLLNKFKNSQFITYIKNINSTLEFKSQLSEIKFNHYDCSHSCWAYKILEKSLIHQYSSDSGEPSGTAGQPILNVIEKNNLIQNGIGIIRHSIGTKLGKKGLIKAYCESAHNVIKSSNFLLWNDICFL